MNTDETSRPNKKEGTEDCEFSDSVPVLWSNIKAAFQFLEEDRFPKKVEQAPSQTKAAPRKESYFRQAFLRFGKRFLPSYVVHDDDSPVWNNFNSLSQDTAGEPHHKSTESFGKPQFQNHHFRHLHTSLSTDSERTIKSERNTKSMNKVTRKDFQFNTASHPSTPASRLSQKDVPALFEGDEDLQGAIADKDNIFRFSDEEWFDASHRVLKSSSVPSKAPSIEMNGKSKEEQSMNMFSRLRRSALPREKCNKKTSTSVPPLNHSGTTPGGSTTARGSTSTSGSTTPRGSTIARDSTTPRDSTIARGSTKAHGRKNSRLRKKSLKEMYRTSRIGRLPANVFYRARPHNSTNGYPKVSARSLDSKRSNLNSLPRYG